MYKARYLEKDQLYIFKKDLFRAEEVAFFLFRAEEDHVITIDLEKINTSSARNNKKSNFLCSKQILFENIWYDPFQDSVL